MRAWMIGLAAMAAPVWVFGGAAMATEKGAQPLTLERIFASPDLAGLQPQSMKLSPDGKLVTLLKPRPDEKNRFDLWALDTADAMGDATKIADPLLLIHGMSDDNVVFENSTAFAAKMQAADRPFEMMFYPGKTHAAGGSVHAWRTIFDFFDRTVKNRQR